MGIGRALGRGVRSMVFPVLLASAAAFFVWHASHGDRGLIAKERRLQEIAAARAELAQAVSEREAAERRVNALRGREIDRDQLEERARALLNVTARDEIVIPYQVGQRLF
jgi:cell division protein FtsB